MKPEKMIKMEVTETEQAIILSYRRNSWAQPSIRKILDVIRPDDKPRIINLMKKIPAATGGRS